MQKRIGEKRKLRKLFSVFFRSFIVFVFFLVILLALYFKLSSNKGGFISPIPKYFFGTKTDVVSTDEQAKIKSLLEKENFNIDTIQTATDSSILVTTKEGQEFIFSPVKDLSEQVASLQAVITRLTIEGKRIKRVDLRFDNPVIAL